MLKEQDVIMNEVTALEKSLEKQSNIETKKQDNYDYTVGLIRVILTFLVVIGHAQLVTPLYQGKIKFNQLYIDLLGNTVNNTIYQFHMVAFMILTGYLYFKYDHYNKGFKVIVKNKFMRLLIPYFLGFFVKDIVLGNLQIKTLTDQILGLNTEHLWYIKDAFICMMFYAILRKFNVQNKQIMMLLLLVTGIHGYIQTFYGLGISSLSDYTLNQLWLICFYIGDILSNRCDIVHKLRLQNKQIVLAILCWQILCLMNENPAGLTRQFNNEWYATVGLLGSLIFYNICIIVLNKLSDKQLNVVRKIDKYTYSMYICTNLIVIAQSKFVYDHHIDISGIGATVIFILINSIGAIVIQIILKRIKDDLVKVAFKK